MPSFQKNTAPHIRSNNNLAKVFWTYVFSLFPAVGALIFFQPLDTLRLFGISITGAVLAELTGQLLFKTPPSSKNGSVILIALLFGVMLPSGIPTWLAFAGSFFAVFVGREIFGGLGMNIFLPAALGHVFLHVAFPGIMNQSVAPLSTALQISLSVAISLGGLLLLIKRLIRWEVPAIYLLILFAFSFLSPGAFLAGFYFATDSTTTPGSRWGQWFFALGAALLAVAFGRFFGSLLSLCLGILWMNAWTPWLESWTAPRNVERRMA